MYDFFCVFNLTHYQTTNFRLFQTERVCRRQFHIRRKGQKVIQTVRKHCGKKEKLLVTSNFSFSHSVFKRLVSQGRQKASLCGNGLMSMEYTRLYHSPDLKQVFLQRPTHTQSAFDTDFPFAYLKFNVNCFSVWYGLPFQTQFLFARQI